MKKNTKRILIAAALILAVVVAVAAICLGRLGANGTTPTSPAVQTEPVQTPAQTTAPSKPTAAVVQGPIALGYDLQIIDSGKYSGLYMEDGTNETVSDVMMLIVENKGTQDVQLAQITAWSAEEEYHFSLTNLAAGQRAVVLDDQRKAAGALLGAELGNTALFQEPMSLYEEQIEIGGLDGMLNVKNISDADLSGDIYVYYKYASEDLYYGGITFRVRVEGGLKAGELRQIPAGHFTPEGCEIVQVTIYG